MGSKAAQGQTSLPGDSNFLYVLPQDKELVQLAALGYALESAWSAHNQIFLKSPFLVQSYIHKVLDRVPGIYLQIVVKGKKGTNNAPAFRDIFYGVAKRAIPAALVLLAHDGALVRRLETLSSPKPEPGRNIPLALSHEIYRAACANLPRLAATPENEPLVLTWPLLDVQEGGD